MKKPNSLFALILLLGVVFLSNNLVITATASDEALRPYYPVGPAKDYITESEFNEVIYYLQQLYAPEALQKGNATLEINGFWNDDTFNAYAIREDKKWNVSVFGGFARAEGMNKDAFALFVCHEIGHHLGGAPLTYKFNGWPSSEGQADYWATSKCLKKYYTFFSSQEFVLDEEIPKKAIEDCGDVYYSSNEYRVCLRTMNAVKAFERVLNNLPNSKSSVSILTPDKKQVKGTNNNDYPRPQCRLDTVYNGALCYIEYNILTTDREPRTGNCNELNKPGARPLCWYKH